MMGGLAGYTLVLAIAAFVVIRLGKVWDDGRSLLLLVILMLLATSVSFDGALAIEPVGGTLCCAAGLLLSVLLSEGLLWGLRVRLPALFRLPYYLVIGLFFVYPVALRWLVVDEPDSPATQWALFAFPSLAAAAFLLLLPAVWRGAGYVRNNGTPWPWPWYPFMVFFMMGLGVCGRSFYLCVSMHTAGGFGTIFAPYFVVPFLLVANLLVLEMGAVAGWTGALRTAMAAPLGLIVLASIPPGGRLGARFLQETFLPTIGSGPLLLTALAVAALYGWAVRRRVPYAVESLCAALLVLAVVRPDTVDWTTVRTYPQAFPILAIGAIQGVQALRRPGALRCLMALGCFVIAATLEFRETPLTVYHGAVPAHLMLGAVMLVGAAFSGPFARWLQHAGAVLLLLGAVAAVTGSPVVTGDLPPAWLSVYAVAAILTALGYGYLVRNRLYLASAAAGVVYWLALGSMQGYRQLRPVVSGLDYILSGLLSLVVAMLISLAKMGAPQRWLAHYRQGRRR
jgi:hypothetical protein